MAQTGNFTPILLYASSTVGNAPAAGNLTNSTLGSELAINIADGKLFYKDSSNAVQVIGWKVRPATAGGTGLTSFAVGDLMYADTTTTLAKLADVATGNALISGGVGVAPSWGKIGLTTHVSGILPVANGGTGSSTAFTTGSVVFAGASGVYTQDNAAFFWDDTNNRLGINIATPTSNLDVRTSLSATTGVQNIADFYAVTSGSTNSGYGASIKIFTKNANGNYWPVGISALNSAAGSNLSDLGLYTAAAGATLNERMRIFSSGGVSIGNTTDPGVGNLFVNNTLFATTASPSSGYIYNQEKLIKLAPTAASFDVCTITSAYTYGALMVEFVGTTQYQTSDQRTPSSKKSLITFKIGSITVTDLYTASNGNFGTINFTYVSDGVMKINITGATAGNGQGNGIGWVKVVGGNASSGSVVTPTGFTIT
jgi:hypothetical protein